MATLAEKNDEVVVLKIDISEPDSAVSRQYKIQTIPYFKVYDLDGSLIGEGEKAIEWLDKAMQDAKLAPRFAPPLKQE